ncbi:MAG: flagellar export chaperone FliS [Syntrophomonadaceae bacterium]|nr:flagellar export chaperone FliS [Syntrophomonadaceae bacterium]
MSINVQAYDNYKRATVETAAPGKLLLMLYDGAIKNIDNAKKAINSKDMNTAHEQIIKAQDIILELIATLNMDYAIAKNLFSLYEYLHYQLVQANLNKDIKPLDEVKGFLVELRETWEAAIKKAGSARVNPAVSLNQGLNVRG